MAIEAMTTEIPARRAIGIALVPGEAVEVINTHGGQVVDCFAFGRDDASEFLSMEHTRVGIGRIIPRVGDLLLSNRRRPMLSVVADTSPGLHDTLIAACDAERYRLLGHVGHHDNCAENLHRTLAAHGMVAAQTPCPLNLFMNIPVDPDGMLRFEPSLARPGDSITLAALMPCLVVLSACPQDMVPVNGLACTPVGAAFRVRRT
jgi:uncharacterized protein YcgI (DUF1989 family)